MVYVVLGWKKFKISLILIAPIDRVFLIGHTTQKHWNMISCWESLFLSNGLSLNSN